jgi:hypothetical protein
VMFVTTYPTSLDGWDLVIATLTVVGIYWASFDAEIVPMPPDRGATSTSGSKPYAVSDVVHPSNPERAYEPARDTTAAPYEKELKKVIGF